MLKGFQKTKLLVIGDIMIDRYIFGKSTGLSYEYPLPIVEINKSHKKIGGAGIVMENSVKLGSKVFAIGAIGNDEEGKWSQRNFKKLGIKFQGIISNKTNTIVRTRVLADNHQVARFDEPSIMLSDSMENKILNQFKKISSKVNCIVVCDYDKGVISPKILETIREIANKGKTNVVISTSKNHQKYSELSFIHKIKFEDALELIEEKTTSIGRIMKKLNSILKSSRIILTKGQDGISAFHNGKILDISATHHTARDRTSVGEILTSAFSVAYSAGHSFEDSCIIGNVAAGIAVEKVGIKNIEKTELSNGLKEYYDLEYEK